MNDIYIRDNNFFNDKYPIKNNPYFNWIWDNNKINSHVTVFTDGFLREVDTCKSKYKIAWLVEPPVISPFIYNYIKLNYQKFDLIFTFDESLLSINNKFKYYPYGSSWIHEKAIYQKSKNVSIIASNKNVTVGQKLRHDVITRFKNIDVYGLGYKPIENKLEGLKDYKYSIAIENSKFNSYFTEKLMDCFVTGTIPIYWGCPKISEFFNKDGIYTFDSIDDLSVILNNISEKDYNSKIDAIKDNFERTKEYMWFEKHLWNSGLRNYFM